MQKKNHKKEEKDISEDLARLEEIARWFEEEKDFNLEEGVKKVREATLLAERVRARLQEVENEFRDAEVRLQKSVAKE
jgi:exonuclease VII small subunit